MDQKLGVQSLFDELSATYDSTGIDFFGQIAVTLIEHARVRDGWKVLDVGCGAGAGLRAASAAVGPTGSVVGIDLAQGMVERARSAVRELGLDNVSVQVGDAERPPAEPRSVDAIVASLVVFFLPNIGLALDAYAQALVPSGTLAFSTFVDDDDWAAIDRLLAPLTSPPPAAQQAWFESPSGIRSILDAHRFEAVSIEDVTHHVEFPSVAAFHEWSWSTGWRATWSAIPAEQRETAKAAVEDYLQSLRERRGSLRLETTVRYTRAEAT
ncbi:MAG TPA: methyltransferase domain-containing protein [Gaiellaceae bacterium]|nr:methyltransferase domain-containing protein [Gaiellaceae bacterium]